MRVLLSIFVWLIWVPYVTVWIWRMWFNPMLLFSSNANGSTSTATNGTGGVAGGMVGGNGTLELDGANVVEDDNWFTDVDWNTLLQYVLL
jgi:hypothetical protein